MIPPRPAPECQAGRDDTSRGVGSGSSPWAYIGRADEGVFLGLAETRALQQRADHPFRLGVLRGDLASGTAMPRVVALDGVHRGQHVGEVIEGKEPLAGGQNVAEAG